jgi:poly(A) polymerase
VKFGTKTIEVATFRRHVEASGLTVEEETSFPAPDEIVGPEETLPPEPGDATVRSRGRSARDRLIQRDNTYGTPEEDAFRRDFTVNALFYDIGTFAVIDYVGGLDDLESRLIRCIGDPHVRFLEDPVRMLRAVVLAARLQFTIDEPILDAIATQRHEIARSAPARLLEEYYKILRSGHAAEAMRQLRDTGLMKEISPELAAGGPGVWEHIAALDRFRARFESAPDSLTNAILAGTLLHPLGLAGRRQRFAADPLERRVELGMLPIARRDVERLHQILALQPRLQDIQAPQRTQRGLLHRAVIEEALTWLEIHGGRPDIVAHWRDLQTQIQRSPSQTAHAQPANQDAAVPFRRRPRRRRRRRRAPYATRE